MFGTPFYNCNFVVEDFSLLLLVSIRFIIIRRCYLIDNIVSSKSYDHTCYNTLARTRKVTDNVHANNVFSY